MVAGTESLSERVYQALCRVPAGKVATYKSLAVACGTRAYRAVGQILHRNPNAPKVPCHRIVASDGTLGGYAGGLPKKIALLEAEGVVIVDQRIDLRRFGVNSDALSGSFVTTEPASNNAAQESQRSAQVSAAAPDHQNA